MTLRKQVAKEDELTGNVEVEEEGKAVHTPSWEHLKILVLGSVPSGLDRSSGRRSQKRNPQRENQNQNDKEEREPRSTRPRPSDSKQQAAPRSAHDQQDFPSFPSGFFSEPLLLTRAVSLTRIWARGPSRLKDPLQGNTFTFPRPRAPNHTMTGTIVFCRLTQRASAV